MKIKSFTKIIVLSSFSLLIYSCSIWAKPNIVGFPKDTSPRVCFRWFPNDLDQNYYLYWLSKGKKKYSRATLKYTGCTLSLKDGYTSGICSSCVKSANLKKGAFLFLSSYNKKGESRKVRVARVP